MPSFKLVAKPWVRKSVSKVVMYPPPNSTVLFIPGSPAFFPKTQTSNCHSFFFSHPLCPPPSQISFMITARQRSTVLVRLSVMKGRSLTLPITHWTSPYSPSPLLEGPHCTGTHFPFKLGSHYTESQLKTCWIVHYQTCTAGKQAVPC